MATIKRSDVIQKAVNDLALSSSLDKIPSETLDKVQLTYALNKQYSSFIAFNSSSTSGTMTITLPTIDSRSEIYLTFIDAGIIKDATCDMATGVQIITLTPLEQGITKSTLMIPTITLTAQDSHVTLPLPYPLKLKPNTNITMTGTFSVGASVKCCSVSGFVVSTN